MATPANDASTGKRIVNDLDANFIVEAGAGTGKTYALVSRVVALVKSGTPMPGIVAITFTEAAAAELSERIRSRLEQLLDAEYRAGDGDLLADGWDDGRHRQLVEKAIGELDQASIQTIHSFAAQILRERPLDAGLPPGWVTLDEVEANQRFADEWDEWLDWALGKDTGVGEDIQNNLRYSFEVGIKIKNWHDIAKAFSEKFDKIRDQVSVADYDLRLVMQHTLQQLKELQSKCNNSSDALYRRIDRGIASVENALRVAFDPVTVASMGLDFPPGQGGAPSNWSITPQEARNEINSVIRPAFNHAIKSAPLLPILHNLRQRFAVDYEARRKAEGVATFDDLLVWTRDLLRDDADARAHCRQKYSRILIDEFQDTDPLQAEIAFYLACKPNADIGGQPWPTLPLEPGKLFIVGDDKQSIYRFRNADIAVVQQVKDGGQLEALPLSENRRSQKPALDWGNAVFGGGDDAAGLMLAEAGVQAEYVALQPNAGIQQDGLGSVQVFGGPYELPADPLRIKQAEQVARLIAAYAGENAPHRLDVYDKDTREKRPAKLRDVCILIRSRTGLGVLLRALDDNRGPNAADVSNIPYRLAGGSLYFDTQEVQDLLNCLRAIDDPTDEVSVVAALRAPALACSDADLLRWRDACGQSLWNYQSRRLRDAEDDADDADAGRRAALRAVAPVWDGMRILREYHARSRTDSVAQVIADFIRDRRLDELDRAENRHREIWRRRQFLIEQARAQEYDRANGAGAAPLTLRQFLRWAETMQDERQRISDTAVPETDDDAVQIMTIHAAKGLEFPIVILLGLADNPSANAGSALFDRTDGAVEVKLGNLQTPGYAVLQEQEKAHAAAEQVRLAYVAATRARDHLLVSLHQSTASGNQHSNGIAAKINAMPAGALPHRRVPDDILAAWRRPPPEPAAGGAGDYDLDGWQKDRADAIAGRSRRQAATATWVAEMARRKDADADAAADDGVALDDKEKERAERYSRGRGGTSLGSAVHGALQDMVTELQSDGKLPLDDSVDMAQEVVAVLNEDIRRLAKHHAAENDIGGREGEIRPLVEQALQHKAVVKALRARNGLWPEISVAAPLDDSPSPVVMEGIIDLLYQDDEGQMVILDYKTDRVRNEADVAAKMKYYRYQGAAYAVAVEQATGKTVKSVQFLFIRHADPKSRLQEVVNWRQLTGELKETVAAGAT